MEVKSYYFQSLSIDERVAKLNEIMTNWTITYEEEANGTWIKKLYT